MTCRQEGEQDRQRASRPQHFFCVRAVFYRKEIFLVSTARLPIPSHRFCTFVSAQGPEYAVTIRSSFSRHPHVSSAAMDITEMLYVATREEWRDWLLAHHEDKREIWLVSYRKAVGKPSVPYNDAVEEALCFGWIDSIRKGIDRDRYAQRFTPRRAGSSYSQTNKERLVHLIASDRVIPSVLATIGELDVEDYAFPQDIVSALQANEKAWAFFQATSPSYQRIRAAYVEAARGRPAEFSKRLRHLIELSAKGKQFGYGIEDYF